MILFGSRARGQEDSHSDWYILMLLDTPYVDRTMEKIYYNAMFDIALETGEAISTFVFSKKEWETKHAITLLFQNIQREGILLVDH